MTVSEILPTLRKVKCSEESPAVAKERCYHLFVNSQRHIAVPWSLGTVLGYDQTDLAYLEGLSFQDRSLSPDPPGIQKPSVHLRWKGFLSLFQTVALPFPLVTTPSGLLFSAKLASPNGLPNTAGLFTKIFGGSLPICP